MMQEFFQEMVELCGIERGGHPSQTSRGLLNDYASPTTVPPVNGGAMRDRTADLLRARQALSQLSYSPKALSATTKPAK